MINYSIGYNSEGLFNSVIMHETMPSGQVQIRHITNIKAKTHYVLKFKEWLKNKNKTFEEFKAEHPYIPRVKTPKEIEQNQLRLKLKNGNATMKEVQKILAGLI